MKLLSTIFLFSIVSSLVYAAPKAINLGVGISKFNSASFSKKLPVAQNAMECTSDEAKQFVSSLFERDDISPSFVGGYKTLKKSSNVTYCSYSYKIYGDMNKQTFWIIKENDQISYYDYNTMPAACDSEEVQAYIKQIEQSRKIKIEEIGGMEQSEIFNNTTLCTLAYKSSDMTDLAKLNYSLSRDEDFNVVMVTDENEYDR